MATLYVDIVNGNDNRGGDSWAVTLTRTDGVANGTTTFTSAGGGFTGLAGRRIYVASGTPFYGTIVSVNSDTSVVLSGTIASASGLTYTVGGAWQSAQTGAASARIAAGDEIRIASSGLPSNLGNATWTDSELTSNTTVYPPVANNASLYVTLATARTKNIDMCETAWVASPNVTGTTLNIRIEGANSVQFTPAGAFTTGKIAYKDLGSNQDFSAYQQISFALRTTINIAANVLRLDLCSDATGDTPVNSFVIDKAQTVGNTFTYMTFNYGSALGNSIRSVSLVALSDPGVPAIALDNIIACLAPTDPACLTLNHLISKYNNQATADWGQTEGFYSIMYINDTQIGLASGATLQPNSSGRRGYIDNMNGRGTVETVTTYAWPSIQRPSSETGNVYFWNTSSFTGGAENNRITYTGGWNTSSNTQEGFTIVDGLNGTAGGFLINGRSWIGVENIIMARSSQGIFFASGGGFLFDRVGNCGGGAGVTFSSITNTTGTNMHNNCCNSLSISGGDINVTGIFADMNNGSADYNVSPGLIKNVWASNVNSVNNRIASARDTRIENVTARNSSYALSVNGDGTIVNSTINNGYTGSVYYSSTGELCLIDCVRTLGRINSTSSGNAFGGGELQDHHIYNEDGRYLVEQAKQYLGVFRTGYYGTAETVGNNYFANMSTTATSNWLTSLNESNFDFNYNTPFSVSFIYKSGSAGTQYIVSKRASTTGAGYHISYYTSNLMEVYLQGPTSANLIQVRFDMASLTDTWYHCVVKYDGSGLASGVRLYVDNVQRPVSTTVSDTLGTASMLNNEPLQISGLGTTHSNGIVSTSTITAGIREVGIWNRAITDNEIATLFNSYKYREYNASIAPYNSGCLAYWSMNAISGTSFTDATGNGNTLSFGALTPVYYFAFPMAGQTDPNPPAVGKRMAMLPLQTDATNLSLDWEFKIPVKSGINPQLKFYVQGSTTFDGTVTVSVRDVDNVTDLVTNQSVTVTTSRTQHTVTSFTPSADGFVRVVIKAVRTTNYGTVYFDGFTCVFDDRLLTDDMTNWYRAKPQFFVGTGPSQVPTTIYDTVIYG